MTINYFQMHSRDRIQNICIIQCAMSSLINSKSVLDAKTRNKNVPEQGIRHNIVELMAFVCRKYNKVDTLKHIQFHNMLFL